MIDKVDGKMQRFMRGFYDGWNNLVYKARRKAKGPKTNKSFNAVPLTEMDKMLREAWAPELKKQMDSPSAFLQMLDRR